MYNITKREAILTLGEAERIYGALGRAHEQLRKANDYIESLERLKKENEELMKQIKLFSWEDEEGSKKTLMALLDEKFGA